ncbi:MAG: hypothetical protein GY927_05455, partial [bacterium]|nr:hypothetical protein [bacterium]
QELLALYRVSVIYSGKHGKYGRPLVRVYVHNGMWGKRSVARILIKEKLARPYDGGKREGWC